MRFSRKRHDGSAPSFFHGLGEQLFITTVLKSTAVGRK